MDCCQVPAGVEAMCYELRFELWVFADICEGAWPACPVFYWCEKMESWAVLGKASCAEVGDPWLLDKNNMVVLFKG